MIHDDDARAQLLRSIEGVTAPESTGPDESDYIITDVGTRGYTVVNESMSLGTFDCRDQAEDTIRAHAARSQVFPDVWFVSDHGNASKYGEPGFGEPFNWELGS